ncbi:S8 family serine peptidase [Kitasatospora brasiliensis]|uniref:S8 family serine peptidase n=1 Tax=Kitasatospora brasiliensis TaxID=3058040 RepID=UPI00292F9E92|nr:S8 family serine peptidase [Kitasatospora sp. K002]
MAIITINGVSIDPLSQSAELARASLVPEDASTSDYILVQTTHVPSGEEKDELARHGVVIHEYISESTYLCGYRPTDLAVVRGLTFVAWAGVYPNGFKIAESLRATRPRTGVAVLTDPLEGAPRGNRPVDVILHEGVDAEANALRERISEAAGVGIAGVRLNRGSVRLEVSEAGVLALASLDEVRQVEEVPEMVFNNNVAGELLHAKVALNGTRYRGEGQVVAVADSGLDNGDPESIHPAFTGRVKRLTALGRTSPDCVDDPDGHGTHVAGSVLGNGASKSMGGAICGTAPEALLVLQSTLDTKGGPGGLPQDLHDLFEPPYREDGARIHTNSWGPKAPGKAYDKRATDVDDMVWEYKDLVICFSAGNNGTDGNGDGRVDSASIGGVAGAKNCITVGASESNRPQATRTYGDIFPKRFPANPIRDDKMADNPTGMAAFSSRGPTREGRIKPDVVAPGSSILSAHSRKALPDLRIFGTSTDPDYHFDSGTSMATPLVAGCLAVLRETLVKNGVVKPSSALLKALLINGADDLPGQYTPTEAGSSPNNDSGFGLVNLQQSIVIPDDSSTAGFIDAAELKQGQEHTFKVTVPQGISHTLKATLVWSDPPGADLQNDLDLIVRAGGLERHGNMGTGIGFDRANNVEQICWDVIPAGEAEITVRAHRITKHAQPYAVVWRFVWSTA